MALLAWLAIALAQDSSDVRADVLRLGGEWVDISSSLPLSATETTSRGWRGGALDKHRGSAGGFMQQASGIVDELWGAMRRGLGSAEEEPAQWYLALTDNARIDRLEASASVAIGLPANVGVHVMTATPTAARRLAADSQVRWVGPRSPAHKFDSTLRQFTDLSVERRTAPVPESTFSEKGNCNANNEALAEYLSLQTLVVTLVTPRTHSRGAADTTANPRRSGDEKIFGISSQEFVKICEKEFARRGWGSTAAVISNVRVAIHLDASLMLGARRRQAHERRQGEAEGGKLETVKNVAEWLGGRWEVLWVEPKQMFRPTVRYASKMLTISTDQPNYQSDVMRMATANALNNPLNTGQMQIVSVGGGRTGKFCMHLNDTATSMRLVIGANGSHPTFFNPLTTAVISMPILRAPMHPDGLNRTLALQLVLPSNGPQNPLYYPDDYFVGMQIELQNAEDEDKVASTDCFPWPYEATTFALLTRPAGCPRMITGYSAVTGRVDIYPPWKLVKTMLLNGVRVRIRPLLMPGDHFTVYADAENWQTTIGLDWIKEMLRADVSYRKSMVLTMKLACQRLAVGGARNTVPGQESTATFLRDHGFGQLQVSCSADVAQDATVSVSKGDMADMPCSQVCQTDRAIAELEMKTGVCVYNQSKVVAVGELLVSSQGPLCSCKYAGNVPLKIQFKIPDANPLWDRGLNGSRQIIGMADTGLDASNCLLSEKDANAGVGSNMVRPVDVNVGAGACCAATGACCADSRIKTCCLDMERRKLVGYQLTATENCALCDTCAKRIKWDRTLLFGDVAKVEPGSTFLTPFPHRCGDASDAIQNPLLRSQMCCGHSCPALRTGGCMLPASPCGICECRMNPVNPTLKVCSTADKLDKFEPDSDCDEDNCKPCCHACGHDARLWPRRYDKYGAELEVNIIAKAQPPGDFPIKFRLFVFTRDDYERFVVWSESNAGKDPINADPNDADQMPLGERPTCLNPGCMQATSEKKFEGNNRIKLPPSRYGYGVVITNGQSDDVSKHTFVLYGGLQDGAGLQMYTASRPCGDSTDDAGGHGTLCASVAAGSVDPDVTNRAERLVARQYQGIAKGAGLFMFDLSAGSRGADNITVPIDFYTGVLQPSYDRGVRIMSNSWSCYFPQVVCDQLGCVPTKSEYCNTYSTAATDMDTFVFDRPQMLLLAPAGDANALAYDVSQKSIRSPGTCKNCISVGSSHSYNSAILQAIPYMDAMDKMSAPLRAHRALCPRHIIGEESLWRKEETVASDDTASDAGNGAMPQTTPAGGGVSLDDFRDVEDKYPVPVDCCNDDPQHNAQIQGFIDFRNGQLQTQRDGGQPQAIIDKTLRLIAEQKARLYPCTFAPSCCNLNTQTQADKIDANDWTSLGPQQAICCKSSYAPVTRAANALHRTDFDVDKIAGFSAQGPVQDDAVLKGKDPGLNPVEGAMRIKPDLVAPGAYLVGANSAGPGPGGGARKVRHCNLHGDREQMFDENNTLVSMGGTSIATAAMAGAAAIVRQYFEDGYYPSGTLVFV